MTRQSVADLLPVPTIEIVPMPASESLKQFIRRYSEITTLTFTLAPTNDDLDNDSFIRQFRESRQLVKSDKSQLKHSNASGLDKNGVLKQVDAAKQGNAFVKLTGKDAEGHQLIGDNDDFSVRAEIGEAGMSYQDILSEAFRQFQSLVKQGIAVIGTSEKDFAKNKLKNFLRARDGSN